MSFSVIPVSLVEVVALDHVISDVHVVLMTHITTSCDAKAGKWRFCLGLVKCNLPGAAIATYGIQSLTFNLGLRRTFHWVFLVADVTTPIIGADFLRHFDLLVDTIS